MKIGIVLYPTFGGSGIVATELGKALSRKGHQIHFITYSQPVKLGILRENIYYQVETLIFGSEIWMTFCFPELMDWDFTLA